MALRCLPHQLIEHEEPEMIVTLAEYLRVQYEEAQRHR